MNKAQQSEQVVRGLRGETQCARCLNWFTEGIKPGILWCGYCFEGCTPQELEDRINTLWPKHTGTK